ncbi:MAG TPA: hypothetical protein DCS93_24625 [Microscillaceae bacterium]|nr:hypothetical protein [Microscillaceae bacterium]
MLEKVYQSEFAMIKIDDSKFFTSIVWTEGTTHLEDYVYRKEVLNFIEIMKKHQTRYVLDDARLFNMPIVPETQEWVAKMYSEKGVESLEKYAMLMPQDYISKLSASQNITEAATQRAEDVMVLVRQFNAMDTAMSWLGIGNA